jgi:hypothetical protein
MTVAVNLGFPGVWSLVIPWVLVLGAWGFRGGLAKTMLTRQSESFDKQEFQQILNAAAVGLSNCSI